MPKSIKISEEDYQRLLELQRPRETFSQLVERLLITQDKVAELVNMIEGVTAFEKRKLQQLKEKTPIYQEVNGKRVLVDGLHRVQETPTQ